MYQADDDSRLWRRIAAAATAELAALPVTERRWLDGALREVARLQEELHALFLAAGGECLCGECLGGCCGCGKHHLTLVNLLGCLVDGRLPAPDFTRTCPWLGEEGCLIPPSRRPFNCVTFVCGEVEERLGAAGRDAFYGLERQLRRRYESFDLRYAGSSLRGILIRAARLGGCSLLAPPEV